MKPKIKEEIVNVFANNESVNLNPTCYVYDLNEITERIHEISENKLRNVKLYYAMKANPNQEILKHVISHDVVSGIEIASIGELEKLREIGLSDSKVLFTGPGKTENELIEAIKSKIRLINVESVVEAIRINKIAENLGIDKVNILVRVNINYYLDGASEYMAGISTKMGIDQDKFFEEIRLIKKLEHLNINGLHVFAADGVLDYNVLIKYAEFVFDFVKEAESVINVDIIDFGGGFGIDYTKQNRQFDTKAYFDELDKLVSKYNFNNKEIILELGKFIVGSSGYYATRIIDIKESKGMKHIVTAGGVNHMRLPIATDRKHPVYIINTNEPKLYENQLEVNDEIVDIEGPLCMTEDKISWDELIEHATVGDIVVLTQSGAYCYTASTLWFLSHELPLEIILK